MRRGIRNALSIGALAAGIALTGASPAKAQVRFEGSLPVPNGRISIGFGGFRAGTVVPYGYEIYSHPDFGYGFSYESQWIPVERLGDEWVVVERPVRFVRGDRDDWRFARPYERWEDRRGGAYGGYGQAQERRFGGSSERRDFRVETRSDVRRDGGGMRRDNQGQRQDQTRRDGNQRDARNGNRGDNRFRR